LQALVERFALRVEKRDLPQAVHTIPSVELAGTTRRPGERRQDSEPPEE
jgi:hypothetical protein